MKSILIKNINLFIVTKKKNQEISFQEILMYINEGKKPSIIKLHCKVVCYLYLTLWINIAPDILFDDFSKL